MDGICLDISDGDVPLTQLQFIANGSLSLSQQTTKFPSLTNFSAAMNCGYQGRVEFPALTQLVTTNGPIQFSANGGHIGLSHVTGLLWTLQTVRSLNEDWGGLNTVTVSADWGDLTATTETEDWLTLT